MNIDIDDTDSWPDDFLQIISDNKALFIQYHQEEKRVDKLCREDIALRINRPLNPHKEEYEAVAAQLDTILQTHNIVGYHCTRLTAHEIQNIRSSGLKILTPDLIELRLQTALNQGILSAEAHAYISNSSMLKSSINNEYGERTGMIWFCPNQETLSESDSVYRLFRSWGGEALYNGHEEDEEIAPHLRSIGAPCIVKCAMPFSEAENYSSSYAKRFISRFILDEIEYPEPPYSFDMHMKRDLTPAEILGIIKISDPQFEELTDYKNWPDEEQIV
jgi:hypothetical protein